jgi:hypothetical protein
MATTTPNFGWAVPTSTDLVKDGAVAIETLGDSIDASLVDLKGGTTDQVLAKNSNTDMDFKWVTPATGGGGKVLQVVTATTSTTVSNSTSTYADTGLTASITPSASTSRILVLVAQNGIFKDATNSGNAVTLRLMRGATQISKFADYYLWQNASGNLIAGASTSFVDSPATTSSTTYKTQFMNPQNSATVSVQKETPQSTIILLEIGA